MRPKLGRLGLFKILLSIYLPMTLLAFEVYGRPPLSSDYVMFEGGLIEVPGGAYVEGSSDFGGMQPDYYIDTESDEMRRVMDYGRRIGKTDLPAFEKIDRINKYIDKQFPGVDYEDPRYTKTSRQYLKAGKDVPLSKYLVCGAGVCREHALVTHFVLKAAGFESYHAYAKIHRSSVGDDYDIYEDHAFNVVKLDGELWVVDPYYGGFNGFLLKDLMREEGITPKSKVASFGQPRAGFRNIIAINTYPKIWMRAEDAQNYKEKSIKPRGCEQLRFKYRNKD